LPYPPLVKYKTVDEYRTHYEAEYCQGPIATFDSIAVRFRKQRFDHDFFESSKRDKQKDVFSPIRAERIDWIKRALQDSKAVLCEGWDSKKKRYSKKCRVAVVQGNYVVVIRMTGKGGGTADFVTAFVADSPENPSTIDKILGSPKWT